MPPDDSIDDLFPAIDDADLAATLVRRAGQLAARMRADGLHGEHKTSITDVVTAADRAAEALVAAGLARCRPADGIHGEEGASAPSTSGRTWVIDPVDGTYNFLSGLSTWCSALALRDERGSVLGAVHQPQIEESWLGGRDRPTTLDGVALAPLRDLPLDQVAMATYLHPGRMEDPRLREAWEGVVRGAATVRMLGSGSCELASVAAGRLGVWVQESVADWDWFPGAALVEAAGGRVERVTAAGTTWSVAGRPSAVQGVLDRLAGQH